MRIRVGNRRMAVTRFESLGDISVSPRRTGERRMCNRRRVCAYRGLITRVRRSIGWNERRQKSARTWRNPRARVGRIEVRVQCARRVRTRAHLRNPPLRRRFPFDRDKH